MTTFRCTWLRLRRLASRNTGSAKATGISGVANQLRGAQKFFELSSVPALDPRLADLSFHMHLVISHASFHFTTRSRSRRYGSAHSHRERASSVGHDQPSRAERMTVRLAEFAITLGQTSRA
jgi:hypothetical protein